YSLGGGLKVSNGWEALRPTGFYETFGPELSFGQSLLTALGGNFAICKFTDSGSQMNDWTPEGTAAKERNLYAKFIGFIRDSINEIEKRGNRVEVAGIFYHVGENDMAFAPYRRSAIGWLKSTIVQSRLDFEMPGL
ncbi:MAG: sialate O-acetylesterase, partial [Armatimonadota bacterium]